ncbi:PadR family transcriptional regulator [Kribbella jiaozuonensis]|uniref:Helix-turn-helix transcriptional regulator n=1 Tax=Kribbella jiaozuonensis TaxID=2575441 RepID=A0A4U3LQC6_9ACTN|nr:PadR family transcriptional regulator [Kribbella jiaozuonensis]TKK77900.1 helix-turn-helix transcriptional regulator [Kribbella jiaozuonensis]
MLGEQTERHIHGYELMEKLKTQSGTLYPILRKLEECGWLSSMWELGDPKELGRKARHGYRLTEKGRSAAVFRLANTVLPPNIEMRAAAVTAGAGWYIEHLSLKAILGDRPVFETQAGLYFTQPAVQHLAYDLPLPETRPRANNGSFAERRDDSVFELEGARLVDAVKQGSRSSRRQLILSLPRPFHTGDRYTLRFTVTLASSRLAPQVLEHRSSRRLESLHIEVQFDTPPKQTFRYGDGSSSELPRQSTDGPVSLDPDGVVTLDAENGSSPHTPYGISWNWGSTDL